MGNKTYTTLPSVEVISLCKAALAERDAYVARKLEEASRALTDSENVRTKRKNAWRRLLFMKPLPLMTYEEGLQRMKEAEAKDTWLEGGDVWEDAKSDIYITGGYWWRRVEYLLSCAEEVPSATHDIDGELLDFIIRWSKP